MGKPRRTDTDISEPAKAVSALVHLRSKELMGRVEPAGLGKSGKASWGRVALGAGTILGGWGAF